MLQQVVAAAVDGLLRHEVAAVLTQSLKHIVDGGGTGCHSQRGYAALQSRDPLLQHVLGGVGQTAVDVAGIGQAEPGSGVLTVAEHIGSGGVNGNGAGIGSGIRLLLANMELQGFKFIVRHNIYFLSLIGCVWLSFEEWQRPSHSTKAEVRPNQCFHIFHHREHLFLNYSPFW